MDFVTQTSLFSININDQQKVNSLKLTTQY